MASQQQLLVQLYQQLQADVQQLRAELRFSPSAQSSDPRLPRRAPILSFRSRASLHVPTSCAYPHPYSHTTSSPLPTSPPTRKQIGPHISGIPAGLSASDFEPDIDIDDGDFEEEDLDS